MTLNRSYELKSLKLSLYCKIYMQMGRYLSWLVSPNGCFVLYTAVHSTRNLNVTNDNRIYNNIEQFVCIKVKTFIPGFHEFGVESRFCKDKLLLYEDWR